MSPDLSSPSRMIVVALLAAALVACEDGATTPEATNNPCAVTTPIAMGQSVTGRLSLDDCRQAGGAYADRWAFDLAVATPVRIDLRSGNFDAYLELQSATGAMIAQNDDAGSLDSRILATLPAGSYVIVARSLGADQVGSYQLAIRVGPDCTPVGSVQIGQAVSGTIAADDCIFEWGGLIDNWTLELDERSNVRIDVVSSDFDEAVIIRDERGDVFWAADASGPLGIARAEVELSPGAWTISPVSVFEVAGAYDLTVDIRPACTPGTALVLGETEAGSIDLDACLYQGWAAADSFALVLDADTPLDLVLKSTDFLPRFVVLDRSGHEVAAGYAEFNPSTGMPTGTARMSTSLPSGTYAVLVIADGGFGSTGTYQFTVSELTCAAAVPVAFGASESGVLESGDCLRPGGAFQDSWELVLAAETPVRIDLESGAFDAFLILKDDSGAVIESNDDGGAGVNARIQRTLSAGTYVIEASALDPGSGGSYVLTVGDPPSSPVSPATVGATAAIKTPEPTARTGASVEDRGQAVIDAVRRRFGTQRRKEHRPD